MTPQYAIFTAIILKCGDAVLCKHFSMKQIRGLTPILNRHTIYTHNMSTHRAHILLPDDLIREIDDLVGPRGRSSFLVETARNEVRRRKLLKFLESSGKESEWVDKQHPELAGGSASWVRKLRAESEKRHLRRGQTLRNGK